jgi:DNA-directed RNA polymerase specialized sigma24 family protein
MNQYRKLSTQQEKYLLKAADLIYRTYLSGVDEIYQWRLNSERTFIEKILTHRGYDLYNDADRLNSVKSLISHIERKNY